MMANKYLTWLTEQTDTAYWSDSAVLLEIDTAALNGATGVTTNPVLICGALRDHPEQWAAMPEQKNCDRAEELTRYITKAIAEKPGVGFCCAQIDPNKPGDEKAMLEQALRYSKIADNIVIKVPATKAGLRVYEECAARGFNVAATVSFTVAQVLCAAEAFERGCRRAEAQGIKPGFGIAVLMSGRLDDYLRDVAKDRNSSATEEDIRQCGLAAVKRAYGIFIERGYKCKLMSAAGRGPYHITELSGADMILSLTPKIAETVSGLSGPFETRIDIPIPAVTIKRLSEMTEFIKAYEPDGLSPEEFIAYGATNRTLAQFCLTGWDPMRF